MCQKPSFIYMQRGPSWEKVEVACKDCWQCRNNAINGYVGRALCEAHVSDWTVALTLTYRPRDDLAEKVITKTHFQKFIRSVRKRGHQVRYMACGEKGEMYGRVHFHVILFGKGKPLTNLQGEAWPHQKNFHDDCWPHGHMYADLDGDEKAVRYVCKYIMKDKESWFTLSKKPVLGAEWFWDRAQKHIELGVLPSSFEYMPPGGQDGRKYLMTRTTRREFLLALVDGLLDIDVRIKGANEVVREAIEHSILYRAKKNGVDLTLPEMVDRMREQQGKEAREWSGRWFEDFQKQQEISQCLEELTGATTHAEVTTLISRASQLGAQDYKINAAAPPWLNLAPYPKLPNQHARRFGNVAKPSSGSTNKTPK